MTEALKQFSRWFWRVIFLVIICPLLWLISPVVRIRLGYISNQRIGHLTLNTEAFIRRRTVDGWPKRTIYLFTTADPANRQMLEMYKRRLNIFESKFISHIYFACRDLLKKTKFYQPITWSLSDQTAENIQGFSKPIETVTFTPEEEQRGKRLLEQMGIESNAWFACFHARDLAYFLKWRPELKDHWEKTTFRNADIEDFRGAMTHVAQKDGYAIRVGAVVDEPMGSEGNQRIIDYASNFRTDFGDIYLLAKCRFLLASNSGIIYVPLVFNKPVAVANMAPPSGVMYRSYDLFIPRLIRRRESSELLDFQELKKLGFFDRDREMDTEEIYAEKGLEPVDNSPEEIKELCDDMIAYCDNVAPSQEARELQLEFQRRYQDYIGVDNGLGMIAPSFAMKYKHLIIPK